MDNATRGGRREGAGRKPLAEGIVRRLFALTLRHVELLEQYRQRQSLRSGSAAMRHLIESSEKANLRLAKIDKNCEGDE